MGQGFVGGAPEASERLRRCLGSQWRRFRSHAHPGTRKTGKQGLGGHEQESATNTFTIQLAFAKGEVAAAVHWLRTTAGFKEPEDVAPTTTKKVVTRYVPLGVAVGIVPWNFPIQLACGKWCVQEA